MEKKTDFAGLLKATRNLLNNRISISAAQDLILKSLLDVLREEVSKLTGEKL